MHEKLELYVYFTSEKHCMHVLHLMFRQALSHDVPGPRNIAGPARVNVKIYICITYAHALGGPLPHAHKVKRPHLFFRVQGIVEVLILMTFIVD